MDKTIHRLLAGLDQVAEHIARADASNAAVSRWSVGLQLEHVLLSDDAIIGIIEGSSPLPPTEAPIAFMGRVVLLTGFVPRGKGQAPEPFRPAEAQVTTMADRVAGLRDRLNALAPHLAAVRADRRRFQHPVFGGLTRGQWLELLRIHQDHHLAIVRDILKAA